MKRLSIKITSAAGLFFLMGALLLAFGKTDKVLNFDHKLHVEDNGLSCTDCHSTANLTTGKRAIPEMDVCGDCHEVDNEDECATCHVNPDDPVAVPGITGMYEGFSHKPHLAQKLDCTKCHAAVLTNDDPNSIPTMKDCQNCHTQLNGTLDCATCHMGEEPKPETHKNPLWAHDHGIEASQGTIDCNACHEQASCDECHQGENINGTPHPPTWKFNHFAESAYGAECLTCHETRESCTTCHKALLQIPHEMGAAWANKDGGNHVDEARAYIEECLACHEVGENDPTCARCHQ